MFGPRGNPQAKNLFSVLDYLQKRAGVQAHVTLEQAYGRLSRSPDGRAALAKTP
jgi:hypothetical protein